MSENIWHLKRCALLEQLPPGELQALEPRCRGRRFQRGDPIYLPADQADGMLLLASGRAKICNFTGDGKQAILGFIEPGELFGELGVFGSGRREEYAEAAEKSFVLLIPAGDVFRLMEQYPSLSLAVTKLIGFRRLRIERRLKNLLFRSNRERLTHLLVEFSDQYGRRCPDGIELTIKLSHQDLANIIGSTRETVTVVLGELQNEGLVKLGRRKIIITDPQRLAKMDSPYRIAAE